MLEGKIKAFVPKRLKLLCCLYSLAVNLFQYISMMFHSSLFLFGILYEHQYMWIYVIHEPQFLWSTGRDCASYMSKAGSSPLLQEIDQLNSYWFQNVHIVAEACLSFSMTRNDSFTWAVCYVSLVNPVCTGELYLSPPIDYISTT